MPSPQSEQPPPTLPNMPDVSTTLSQYLRTFGLWARRGFQDRLPDNIAKPGLMLQAVDAATGQPINAVYMLSVQATAGPPPSAPTIVMTLMPSGSGQP